MSSDPYSTVGISYIDLLFSPIVENSYSYQTCIKVNHFHTLILYIAPVYNRYSQTTKLTVDNITYYVNQSEYRSFI